MATVNRADPIIIKPSAGGQLRSKLSAENAGRLNYTIKRDWRRVDVDVEDRREGHDYFYPMLEYNIGNQAWPQNQPTAYETTLPITLVGEAEAPNGQRVVVAGTEPTLYAFYPNLNGTPYFDPGATPDDQYVDEWFPKEWISGDNVVHLPEPKDITVNPAAPDVTTTTGGGTGGDPGSDGGETVPPSEDPPPGSETYVQPPNSGLPAILPPTTVQPAINPVAGYHAVVYCGDYMFFDGDEVTEDYQMGLASLTYQEMMAFIGVFAPGQILIRSGLTFWRQSYSNLVGAQLSAFSKIQNCEDNGVALVPHDGNFDNSYVRSSGWTLCTYFLEKDT